MKAKRYCVHCGKEMIRKTIYTGYNIRTGEREFIYIWKCSKYIPIFGIFNIHTQVDEYGYHFPYGSSD